MEDYRVIEIKQSIFEDNNKDAQKLREQLYDEKVFLLNLMSSPGAGKTTLLVKTINTLKKEFHIAVMEADIDSDVDARAIADSGVHVIQLHTGGMCHLDADMTRQGLNALDTKGLDIVFLENVGNLVCPAEFDTGAIKNAMILSVPEGDDKPLKYPLMFSISDVLLINKIDAVSFFDFNFELCVARVKKLNSNIKVIPISAKTGEGIGEWVDWLHTQVQCFRERDV